MDLRMDLMRSFSQSRESEYKEKLQGRFGRLHDKLKRRRDDQVKAIRRNLERDLRKLRGKRRDGQYPSKPDVIQQHADPKSELYAPQMRSGEHPGRRHETILQKRFPSADYIVPREYARSDVIVAVAIFRTFPVRTLLNFLLRTPKRNRRGNRYDAQLVTGYRRTEIDETGRVQTDGHLYTRNQMDGGEVEAASRRSESDSTKRQVRRHDPTADETQIQTAGNAGYTVQIGRVGR